MNQPQLNYRAMAKSASHLFTLYRPTGILSLWWTGKGRMAQLRFAIDFRNIRKRYYLDPGVLPPLREKIVSLAFPPKIRSEVQAAFELADTIFNETNISPAPIFALCRTKKHSIPFQCSIDIEGQAEKIESIKPASCHHLAVCPIAINFTVAEAQFTLLEPKPREACPVLEDFLDEQNLFHIWAAGQTS